MGCGAEEATPAAPVPELRLNSRAGVQVGSASPRAATHLHMGLVPPSFLLSLILPLTAKSFGGALYQRGPGLCRGMGHRPPQSRQDRNQIGINKGVAIQVKTHLGWAELPHGTRGVWGSWGGTGRHMAALSCPCPGPGSRTPKMPSLAQPCCTAQSSTAAGASSCPDSHPRCAAQAAVHSPPEK